jgi:hypothetical protein
VARSDGLIDNWSGDGDFWDRVREGSGTPSLNVRALVRAFGGSGVMVVLFSLVAYIRNWAIEITAWVEGLFGFLEDVAAVGLGAGVRLSDSERPRIPGATDYATRVFRDTATAIQASPALAFVLAVGLVLAVAIVFVAVMRRV